MIVRLVLTGAALLGAAYFAGKAMGRKEATAEAPVTEPEN